MTTSVIVRHNIGIMRCIGTALVPTHIASMGALAVVRVAAQIAGLLAIDVVVVEGRS